MAPGPKTSLLTMLSGRISRLKTTIYTWFVKNHLGTLRETAHPSRDQHTGSQEAAQ
jgi:hypothetical protein